MVINNIVTSQGLELVVIPYIVYQPPDPQLWDSNFCSASIFEMNKYLEGNAKKITCSLHRITSFVRQWKLEDKIANNISQITKFGFVAWDFLTAIYESGWDKLAVSKDKSFRQTVSLQFNKIYTNNANTNKLSSKRKEKKANISRIPFLILSMPSRSVLAKSKFYKKNLSQDLKSKFKGKSYTKASKDKPKFNMITKGPLQK